MSFYKDQLKKYLSEIDLKAGAVLSIGAQNDDRQYFKSADVQEWKTLDVDESFKPDIAFNFNRSIDDEEGDLNISFGLLEHFDAVLAFELWEYIYDPVTAHKNIYALLKPGGVYMGSYPFVYGKHNPAGMDYLRYTDDGIRKILIACGFTNIEIMPRFSINSLDNFYLAEGMRIRKDVDHNVVGYIVKAKK